MTAAAVGLSLLLAAGCGGGSGSSSGDTITIGSKNFTENIILGEMMAQLLEAKTSLHVVRKLNLGGTLVNFNALKAGQVDLYPDYTGTGLVEVLKEPVKTDPQAVYDEVQKQYNQKYGLKWLQPFGFNNTYVMAVREDDAKTYGLQTVSDLAKVDQDFVLGAEQEFFNRQDDGYPALTRVYGLKFKDTKAMDTGLKYKAMSTHNIDVTDAFATDGQLLSYHLKTLEDDRHLFPPYYAAPVVREDTLKAHPEIEDVLNALGGKISDADMQQLNYLVDEKGEKVEKVAHDFLVQKGLLTD